MLDRNLQRQILEHLRTMYPVVDFKIRDRDFSGHDLFLQNLCYLAEHELIEIQLHRDSRTASSLPIPKTARITHRGLDFLEQDGGLSAILGTVRVRIEAQEFLDLLASQLDRLEIPAEEKKTWLKRLRQFSEPIFQSVLQEALIELGRKYLLG